MYRCILSIFLCFCVGILVTGCRESIPKAELETIIATELQTESMTEPEITQPEITQPETTEPETTEPETTEPVITEPIITEPVITEPETAPEKNYIANKNSGKLHSTNCDSLPYEKNRIYFSTIEQAHNAGYTDHHRECMGG
ncbi:MAG: hypothetical protein K2H93_09495 [Oscillospiraceae bacterium]|nr:hypothetical protein [Oscillospiraceae bacterium]